MHCFASTLRLTKSLSVRTKITRIPHLGCNVQKCFRVWQVELLIKLQSITTNMSFLIFGWLVGMRRSILMLGSTLALFLYHAKWSPGHFGSRSSPLLFKSSWSPLGPGNMAQWGQQAQQGDRRGWGGRDRGDRDQWTGGRSGGGGGGYGAHNPYEVQLPKFLTTVVTTDDKDWSSIMMVDKRDDRLVSPFQAWLVSEIMANSASSINVLTERDQVMPPIRGSIFRSLRTIPWTGSRLSWRCRSIPPLVQSVVDGIHPQQGHWLTRLFSHSHGLCSGRLVLPTQI